MRRMLGNMAAGIFGESFTLPGQISCFTTAHKGIALLTCADLLHGGTS